MTNWTIYSDQFFSYNLLLTVIIINAAQDK